MYRYLVSKMLYFINQNDTVWKLEILRIVGRAFMYNRQIFGDKHAVTNKLII